MAAVIERNGDQTRVRLFYALWPPRARAKAWHEAARRWARTHPGAKVVPAERLHLTLVFLGGVPRERLGAFLALGAALGPPPAEPLVLDRFECWSGPRVACLAGPTPEGAWRRFAERLAREARALGAKVEDRPFRPHLTLARKVRPEAFDASGLKTSLPLRWSADRFRLIHSESAAEGLRYRTVGEFG